MPTYSTPGAYIEWQDASAPVIQPLRTDITGFIGIAARGPVNTPVPVESVKQFEAHFGSFIGGGFLAFAVRGFFENGGQRCWIVRVAAARVRARRPLHPASGLRLAHRAGRSTPGPGVWGDGVTLAISTVFPARTFTVAGEASTRWVNVASVAGFQRADLLELQQQTVTYHRVLSHVDPVLRRLYFVHPDAGSGLPYDRVLDGYDRDQPLQIRSLAYTISARENGWPTGQFPALAPIPEHPRYAPRVLAAPVYPLVLPPRAPLPKPPPCIRIAELAGDLLALSSPLDVTPGVVFELAGGADGLTDLTVDDFFAGMTALMQIDEVALVAAPDIVVQPQLPPQFAPPPPPFGDPCIPCPPPDPPRVLHQPPLAFEMPPQFSDDHVYLMQSRLVQLCEQAGDRFALLDPTARMAEDAAQGVALVEEWRTRFDTRNAALYFPWLHVVNPLGGAPTRRIPPSGHVAGIAAQLDLEVGVHRAPANRVLAWAQDVTIAVDDARHGMLNAHGINVLKSPPGLGLRVLGARTLSSDPAWRYVNVRRLMLMVMEAIDTQTQWAVFEPNDHVTRRRIAQSVSELLGQLWQRGALVGATPEQAFAVRCDEVNNTAEMRANGQLVADVAIAPSRPFEYVVLRLGRQNNAFEVIERGTVNQGVDA
ncbi:MAG: phage tail sheath C-terminal domain-containing protein [Kofleriaceae bacterium]